MNEQLIEQIRTEALEDDVPIMEDDGISYVKEYLKQQQITSMLEVGTAVGYSSIVFASYNPQLRITTLEIDPVRYQIARENIAKANLSDRITPILSDARTFHLEGKFDALFLDGPKAHNQQLLENYLGNLNEDGVIIVDDVCFHGFIDHPEQLKTKRLKPLVKKFREFRDGMMNNPEYECTFLEIGDGVLICRRRK